MAERYYYGGQAVIDGVMIRGRTSLVTAVRHPNGSIVTDTQVLSQLYSGRARHLPFLRGVIVLIESLVLGIKSLMYSANISLEEEQEKVSGPLIWLMLAVALGMVVVLFFIIPLLLTKLLHIQSSILFNLVDGLIRVTIFVIYFRVMGTMRDLRRRLRLSRRRAQGRECLRGRGNAGRCVGTEIQHIARKMRHQLSLRSGHHLGTGVLPRRSPFYVDHGTYQSSPRSCDFRDKLRIDLFRRQAHRERSGKNCIKTGPVAAGVDHTAAG